MRSRYVAYARGDIDYIARTTAAESLRSFDAQSARAWAGQARWLGLKLLKTDKGGAEDSVGTVEFVATYRQNGATIEHRELSRFRRDERGEWRFVDGGTSSKPAEGRVARSPVELPPALAAPAQKAGRNDPCPCGSGKKFKKCCGAAGDA